jgi:putative flippase GtrA
MIKEQAQQIFRYIINGLLATLVHYTALTANLKLLGFQSAGIANFMAAAFGITASFLGSRYYVFRSQRENIFLQAARFSGLYFAIAVLHGLVLLTLTDWRGLDYTISFLIATGMQVSLSYAGNRYLVFRA